MQKHDWRRPDEATGMYPMEIAALAAEAGFPWLSANDQDGLTVLEVEAPFGPLYLVLGSSDRHGSFHFLYARVLVRVADAAATAGRLQEADPHGPIAQAPAADVLSLMRVFIMDRDETPRDLPAWLLRVAGEFAMALRLVRAWQGLPSGSC